VDPHNCPKGIGYNGAPQKIPDKEINWRRPDKYVYVIHAEENAIDHAGGDVHSLTGCTIYVTGMPCPNCMRRIVRHNLRRVVYGAQSSNMVPEDVIATVREMAKLGQVALEPYKGNMNWLRDRMAWLEINLPQAF